MLNFIHFMPNYSQYSSDFIRAYDYSQNLSSLQPVLRPYTLHHLKTESHAERNDFFVGYNQTFNSYLKYIENMLISSEDIHQTFEKQMIGLRFRSLYFPTYNTKSSYFLFTPISDPKFIHLNLTNLSELLLSTSTNYLHYCIFIMNCLLNNICAHATCYSECIQKLNQQLPNTLLCFKEPQNESLPYAFSKECPHLYYKAEDIKKMESLCKFMIDNVFPTCLDQCKNWFISDTNIFPNSNSYWLYNNIATDVMRLLFTHDFSITSYAMAVSFGEQLLGDVKAKLLNNNTHHMCLTQLQLIPNRSTELDGLQYKYIQAINSHYINTLRYSMCEIYIKYMSYLHDNEQYQFACHYNDTVAREKYENSTI